MVNYKSITSQTNQTLEQPVSENHRDLFLLAARTAFPEREREREREKALFFWFDFKFCLFSKLQTLVPRDLASYLDALQPPLFLFRL